MLNMGMDADRQIASIMLTRSVCRSSPKTLCKRKRMIESCYWKEELQRIAQNLRPVSKPPRWSERRYCILQRDLAVGFFILRRLIELHKVSSSTREKLLNIFFCEKRGENVTLLNKHEIWELYDLNSEVATTKKPSYIANQFIHSYTSLISRDISRNWSDIYIVSDYDRNDCIWRVPIEEIYMVFTTAVKDYPHSINMTFNPAKDDYNVQTN